MLTLIDGNSLVFRAYYGVHANLTRSDGMPVGAVYGFFNMILPILATAKENDSFVCVFDASRISFRQDIYPEYKANRSATPADLLTQSELIKTGVHTMGIPVLCIPGVEADDVIATIATNNCNNDGGTRIITSDKDLMQLVSNCTFLYDGMKQREIHEPEVFEKFGVAPNQVIDVQSLMGDSTDNVPGVRGVGPKTATELIVEFKTLDNLYANLDSVKNERIRKLLSEHKDLAYISKQLVTLKRDVDLEGLNIQPFKFNYNATMDFITTKIESKSLVAKIEKLFAKYKDIPDSQPVPEYAKSVCPVVDVPTSIEDEKRTLPEMNLVTISTESELDEFLSHITNVLAFDTETTGLNQISDKIVGLSLAYDESHGAYIPIRHISKSMDLFGSDTLAPKQLSVDVVYKKLWPVFTNPNVVKIAHNLKYDLHILSNEGWDVHQIKPFDDTMLLSYILHGSLHGHGLDELAVKYLRHSNIKFDDLFDEKTKDCDKHFETLSIDTATKYSGEDSVVCMALYKLMRPQLNANPDLRKLYEECDLPLCPILMQMERNGVYVNREKLNQLSGIFHKQLSDLEAEIYQMIGHEFNIGSPKQISTVLFDDLHLKNDKKRSTDADKLNDLIDEHPVVEKILNWRSVSKLAGTYADALPHQIAGDGRIHTTYLQTSTNTGRLSSRAPNLQNIPVKTELGEEIRKCFVASPGNTLIAIDYSQIQLRLLADVANVAVFKETFNQGLDIHEQTARKIFNIPNNEPVPRDLRRAAKTINFSIIYGISAFGLSNQLGISREKAKSIIDSYMDGLPEIQEYITNITKFVFENHCVYTPWHRKIEIPESRVPRLRGYATRAAINAPIQGFEADIMRRAMVNIYNKTIEPNKDKIKMLLQVHDEIIFECGEKDAKNFSNLIKSEMENVTKLSVPLLAESIISTVWDK
ncbi:MAG: DNA polymerase I [Alphaproteobacteria bacterium]|nr:DNA polymerase I [Alphaproteobacteria bacterium]